MDNKSSAEDLKQTMSPVPYDTEKLQAFLELFDSVLGSVREPLVVLDADLKVVKANHAFYRTFRYKPEETEGVLI